MSQQISTPVHFRHPRGSVRAGSEVARSPRRQVRVVTEQRSWRVREIELLEEERRRLARDLHDESGHRLTAAILNLDRMISLHPDDADLRAGIEAARQLIKECSDGLHEVAFNLRPPILSDLGLVPALRSLVRRAGDATGVATVLEVTGQGRRLGETIELTAFRAVQEALTNAIKYASAPSVSVSVEFSETGVGIRVADDGVGFDVDGRVQGRPRLGLRGIRERVELAGGEFRVQSRPGRGTAVIVFLPESGSS
jgi:two-component system, NarL family, sensor histidine kinase NreB